MQSVRKKMKDSQLWQKACTSFATFATLATSHLQFCCLGIVPFYLPFLFPKVINPNLPFVFKLHQKKHELKNSHILWLKLKDIFALIVNEHRTVIIIRLNEFLSLPFKPIKYNFVPYPNNVLCSLLDFEYTPARHSISLFIIRTKSNFLKTNGNQIAQNWWWYF